MGSNRHLEERCGFRRRLSRNPNGSETKIGAAQVGAQDDRAQALLVWNSFVSTLRPDVLCPSLARLWQSCAPLTVIIMNNDNNDNNSINIAIIHNHYKKKTYIIISGSWQSCGRRCSAAWPHYGRQPRRGRAWQARRRSRDEQLRKFLAKRACALSPCPYLRTSEKMTPRVEPGWRSVSGRAGPRTAA